MTYFVTGMYPGMGSLLDMSLGIALPLASVIHNKFLSEQSVQIDSEAVAQKPKRRCPYFKPRST